MILALIITLIIVIVLQGIKILKLNDKITWNRVVISAYHDSYAEFMNAINEQEQEIGSLKRQLKEALDAQK